MSGCRQVPSTRHTVAPGPCVAPSSGVDTEGCARARSTVNHPPTLPCARAVKLAHRRTRNQQCRRPVTARERRATGETGPSAAATADSDNAPAPALAQAPARAYGRDEVPPRVLPLGHQRQQPRDERLIVRDDRHDLHRTRASSSHTHTRVRACMPAHSPSRVPWRAAGRARRQRRPRVRA